MARLWLVFVIVAITSSCTGGDGYKRSSRNTKTKYSNSYGRVESKILHYVKPSEAMQAGISMDDDYYEYGYDDYEEVLSDGTFHQYDGHFKVGDPYQVFGVSYIPQNYENYEEIGTASWYGDDFHGKKTANGETYDMESMTAAHPTLPLPSLVRVTNLENNKSVIVRVNDRGPFSKRRGIDVSEKAAEALDFRDSGTAQVKVELLRNETDELLEKLKMKN